MFVEADKDQNDDDLVSAYDSIQNSFHRSWLILTQEEEQRVQQARRRRVILEQFRTALKSKQPRRIAAVYYHQDNQPLLSTSKRITTSQRELAQLARNFTQCLDRQNEDGLLAAYEALQQPSHKGNLDFTQDELRRVQEIRARKVALVKFMQTLDTGTAADIDTACKQLPQEMYTQLTIRAKRQGRVGEDLS